MYNLEPFCDCNVFNNVDCNTDTGVSLTGGIFFSIPTLLLLRALRLQDHSTRDTTFSSAIKKLLTFSVGDLYGNSINRISRHFPQFNSNDTLSVEVL